MNTMKTTYMATKKSAHKACPPVIWTMEKLLNNSKKACKTVMLSDTAESQHSIILSKSNT